MNNIKIKYLGNSKKKVSWSIMGNFYSYNLVPGKTISIRESLFDTIKGFGTFAIVKSAKVSKPIVKPIIEKESTEVITTKDEEVFVKQEEQITEYESKSSIDGQGPCNQVVEEIVEEDVEEETPDVDYMSLSKSKLKKLCRDNGLKVSGNRDDLAYRIMNFSITEND